MGSILDFGRLRRADKERRPRNWNNQELAELYRVHDVLNQAGMSVGMDSGLSDEGDPWFVFFHTETQDVIAHFARIDGMIIAVAFGSDKILQGRDFSAIIKEILAHHHPVALPPQRTAGKVVKLYLHPAVVLSAFVCAAFVLSKKSIAATPDRSERAGEDSSRPVPSADASVGASPSASGGSLFTGSVFASSLAIVAAVAQFDDASADEAPAVATTHDNGSVDIIEESSSPHVVDREHQAPLTTAAADDATTTRMAPTALVETPAAQHQAAQSELAQAEPTHQFLADNLLQHAKPMPAATIHEAPNVSAEAEAPVAVQAFVVGSSAAASHAAPEVPAAADAPEAVSFQKVAWTEDYMQLSINFDAIGTVAAEPTPIRAAEDGVDGTDAAAADAPPPAAVPPVPVPIDIVLPAKDSIVVLTDAPETIYYSGGKVEVRNFTAGQDVLMVANAMLATDYTLQVNGDDVTLLFTDGSSLTLLDLWL